MVTWTLKWTSWIQTTEKLITTELWNYWKVQIDQFPKFCSLLMYSDKEFKKLSYNVRQNHPRNPSQNKSKRINHPVRIWRGVSWSPRAENATRHIPHFNWLIGQDFQCLVRPQQAAPVPTNSVQLKFQGTSSFIQPKWTNGAKWSMWKISWSSNF